MKNSSIEKLSLHQIYALRKVCNHFGDDSLLAKKKLLHQCASSKIDKTSVIKAYLDCLLFMLAYPENKELFQIVTDELQRLTIITKQISAGNNQHKKTQLSATGIENSDIAGSFSFDSVLWMSETFPDNILLYSCDAEIEKQKEIIKHLLPAIEREAFDKNFTDLKSWLNQCATHSKKNSLQLLVSFLVNALPDKEQRDYFYNSLKVFVDIKVDEHLPSRTSARITAGATFYHTSELIRKVDAHEMLSQKISKPIPLSLHEKEQLCTIAKCSLLLLYRETDPVTYANVNATELHDMGRGIKIALYYLTANRRMPVESYVGYMAFKNNIPVAYGGGWILGNFSRIGVNVYEPFRGGESALLFTQILRLYKQRFNVTVFEAEPYQIGKQNPEGIKSGAFWFYYRLGFRPSQKELFHLADNEQAKIHNDKSYRSDERTLKKLADSFMVLKDDNVSEQVISTLKISEAITKMVDQKFEGNHNLFSAYAVKHITGALKINPKKTTINFNSKSFGDLSALLCLIKNITHWSEADKQKTLQLFELKELDSELKYIQALGKHKKLLNELYKATHVK